MYVDGSSNKKGSQAGIVLERPRHFQLELSLSFEFNTSNNQVEYEALLTCLILIRDMRATVRIYGFKLERGGGG